MRLSAWLSEALRNIVTGTTRYVLFTTALTVLSGMLIVADGLAITQQVESAERFESSGAATLILSAQGRIDGAACERLTSINGVQAAGALRQSGNKITFTLIPDSPVPAFEVTPGFTSLLAPESTPGAGLSISRDVAQTLGVRIGDKTATTQGTAQIAAVYDYPDDGRRPGFGYAVLLPADGDNSFDECWARTWPQLDDVGSLLFTALTPGTADPNHPPTLSQLNSSLGEHFDGNTLFRGRITRSTPIVAFAVALALGYVSIRLRYLQLASALHSGVARKDVVVLSTFETLAWSGSAALLSAAVGLAISVAGPPGPSLPLLLNGLVIALASFSGAGTGAILSTLLVKEAFLFRYFKDR